MTINDELRRAENAIRWWLGADAERLDVADAALAIVWNEIQPDMTCPTTDRVLAQALTVARSLPCK
jgi:hypothetical protein